MTKQNYYKTHPDNTSNVIKLNNSVLAFKKYYQSEPYRILQYIPDKIKNEREFYFHNEKNLWTSINFERKRITRSSKALKPVELYVG